MESGTLSEVETFREFLNDCIEEGEIHLSIEDCVEKWRRSRESTVESVEAILQGLSEAKAGLGQPDREFLEDLRSDVQHPEAE